MEAGKSLLLATLLVLVGVATQGSEAKMVALVYGQVPCSIGAMTDIFPNATVQLVLDGGDPISGAATATTNEKGQFLMIVAMTSTHMVISLASNNSKVAVITPPSACNSALPASSGTMAAPLLLRGSRRLGTSAMDNYVRDLVGGGGGGLLPDAELFEALLSGPGGFTDGLIGRVKDEVRRDDGILSGVLDNRFVDSLLGGKTVGSMARLSTGSFYNQRA